MKDGKLLSAKIKNETLVCFVFDMFPYVSISLVHCMQNEIRKKTKTSKTFIKSSFIASSQAWG